MHENFQGGCAVHAHNRACLGKPNNGIGCFQMKLKSKAHISNTFTEITIHQFKSTKRRFIILHCEEKKYQISIHFHIVGLVGLCFFLKKAGIFQCLFGKEEEM